MRDHSPAAPDPPTNFSPVPTMPESEIVLVNRQAVTPAPQSRRRIRYNQAMRVVRRAHLYAGLFMVPWVFLYGTTALLFNHPGAFPDQAARRFGPSEWAGTSLANLPEPSKLAAEVVEALNRPVGDGEPPDYRLIRPDEAGVVREVSATVRSGGRQYTVRIDVGSGEGSAREVVERRRPEPAPFTTREAKTPSPPPLSDLEGNSPPCSPGPACRLLR